MAFAAASLAGWMLVVALGFSLGLLLLLRWPLRFDFNARARGESNGAWLVACGASLALVSVAFAWARGVAPQFTLHVFGRRVEFRVPGLTRPVPERLKSASLRAWRRLRPWPFALTLLEERRHLRLRYLVVDLDYGFRDPLLTGRLAGALYALAGVLPRPVVLRHCPRWDFEDSWEAVVDCRAVVKPWLMLLDVAVYVVKELRSRRAPQPPLVVPEGPSEAK